MKSFRTLTFDLNAPGWNDPIGQEIVLDGWCWVSALRFVAALAGVSEEEMVFIPEWPRGPAGTNCPYFTLERGTGLKPLYRYLPHMTAGAVFANLMAHSGPDCKLRLSRS